MISDPEFNSALDRIEKQIEGTFTSSRPPMHLVTEPKPADQDFPLPKPKPEPKPESDPQPELKPELAPDPKPELEPEQRSLWALMLEVERKQAQIALAVIERLERIEKFLGL
jgi:hypothetical protein